MGIDAEMFVRTKAPVTPEQVIDWAYRAGACFGAERFWILPDEGRHCLEIVDKYIQGGPDGTIHPNEGETLIRVYPATRYYGEGYERGDLAFLLVLADWLEAVIPGAEVWYGGDSSGVCAEPWPRGERNRIFRHWCEVASLPYLRPFGSIFQDDKSAPECPLCHKCLISSGGGQGKVFYSCVGCGQEAITEVSTTRWLKRDEKFI